MLAGQQIQPDLEKNLDRMSSLYLDVPRWKHKRQQDEALYNRYDAHCTLAMLEPQRTALASQGQLGLFENIVMPALPVLIGMTYRGIHIDPVRRDALKAKLEEEVLGAQATFERLAPNVNPASPKQLGKLLYEDLKLPKQFNDEAVTTDKAAISKLLKRSGGCAKEVLDALLAVRAASKLLSTYITDDNIVHPSYFPVSKDDAKYGTATGRLSSQDPNIQNQPLAMRVMYVPPDNDLVFISADYSQIELRIAAVLSGDKVLLEAIEHDVHAKNMEVLQCDRTRAKNVLYGYMYGAGPKRLYETLLSYGFESSIAECRDMIDALKRAYPMLWGWREEIKRFAKQHCYVVTPFGRRRYFYDPERAVPEELNFIPQGTAADILNTGIPSFEEIAQHHGGHLSMLVHDDATITARRDMSRQATNALSEVMMQEFSCVAPGFRVPVKVKIGDNWGEMKEIE